MPENENNEANGAKILVLDDEHLIRLTISAKLRMAGYSPVAAGTVDEAVAILRKHHHSFRAIITDIMMGDMDGFVFRDIVRGMDKTMPIFFMTALDPEEGSGFLKRIVEDPNSYYLPKAVSSQVLLRRVQAIAPSRQTEQIIERQREEQIRSLTIASHVQKSMLPRRTIMTERGFYSALWKPQDMVSGDLYEAFPFGDGTYLYVLGDIQGHGTSAALAMTAVQSFLKQFKRTEGKQQIGPHDIANSLQQFFRGNLAEVTYMTALICVHKPLEKRVDWISCGAPDLMVVDPLKSGVSPSNPEGRGGLPIGMMADTEYSQADVVETELSDTAVCVALTDGVYDMGRDEENLDPIPAELVTEVCDQLFSAARQNGSIVSAPYKFMVLCEEYGYKHCADDVTILLFGARRHLRGIYEQTIHLRPYEVDKASADVGKWCHVHKWGDELVHRVQLVLEEMLMNIYDHGTKPGERRHATASIRLRKLRDRVELTVWDCGTPMPSIAVAGGSAETAFELKNREFSGRGRGRLMMRQLCTGIARSQYCGMNETLFHIPIEYKPGE